MITVFDMHSLIARNIVKRSVGRFFTSSLTRPKEIIDPVQEASLNEKCFLVDENDKVIGTATKRECHAVKEDGTIPLHRAFSVFLFDKKGDLLLQKRSDSKITYPNHYTNSCCSHPIADVPGEDEETNAIGVIKAAQRRLNYELGIDIKDVPIEKFIYITRMIYKDTGDGIWGENEIDYILFLLSDTKVKPNPNEISEIKFVPRGQLDAFITLNSPLTPWFKLISKHKLDLWWKNLHNLNKVKDHKKIWTFEV